MKINMNKLMLSEEEDLVIPLSCLKIVKMATDYALKLIEEFIEEKYNYDLDYESNKNYEEFEKEFLTLHQFLQNINTEFILPYDGMVSLVKIVVYAYDCLDGNFYNFILNDSEKADREKNFRIISKFKKKLDQIYSSDKIFNPDKFVKKLF